MTAAEEEFQGCCAGEPTWYERSELSHRVFEFSSSGFFRYSLPLFDLVVGLTVDSVRPIFKPNCRDRLKRRLRGKVLLGEPMSASLAFGPALQIYWQGGSSSCSKNMMYVSFARVFGRICVDQINDAVQMQ